MFCQPALAACVAFLLLRALKRWWRVAPILVLAGTVFAHGYYTLVSAGLKGGSVLEVPQASAFGLNFTVPKVTAVSDIDLMPAQGLAAIVFRGSQVLYPSVARGKFPARPAVVRSTATVSNSGGGAARNCLREVAGKTKRRSDLTQLAALGVENLTAKPEPETPLRRSASYTEHVPLRDRIRVLLEWIREAATFPAKKYAARAQKLEGDRAAQMNRLRSLWDSDFFVYSPRLLAAPRGPTHLLTLRRAYLLNVTSPPRDFADYGIFRLVPYREVHDWLLFIPSSRGPDYYYERFGASFYQPESDPYRPGNFMSAVGRFCLLEVVNPADRLRLRVSLTRSIMGASRVVLPAAASADGESSTRLPFLGAGSAAVYSEAISPVWSDGRAFVAIDFNQPAIAFPNQKSGLMRLYNREWAIDHRKVIGFCRDISAISDGEYTRLTRPRKIESFPRDLLSDSGLEYSGIYEDGWISDEAFVKLGAASKDETVTVEGMVPSVGTLANGFLTVRVQVNDGPPLNQTLKPGHFKLVARVARPEPTTTVRIRFSHSTPLPGGDGRLVSALLRSISIQ